MQNLITSVVLATSLFQIFVPSMRSVRSDPVLVRSVTSGESINVDALGRVRLLGIASASVPLAKQAREQLASLVLNRWVRLEWDPPIAAAGSNARVPKVVYVVREDGVFVNAEMVRLGLARVSADDSIGRIRDLRRAEQEAQAFRRGMWNEWSRYTRGSFIR